MPTKSNDFDYSFADLAAYQSNNHVKGFLTVD